jgi:hypothetical protein
MQIKLAFRAKVTTRYGFDHAPWVEPAIILSRIVNCEIIPPMGTIVYKLRSSALYTLYDPDAPRHTKAEFEIIEEDFPPNQKRFVLVLVVWIATTTDCIESRIFDDELKLMLSDGWTRDI